MILENNFKQITQLFYSAQYQLGHQQISELIKQNPNLSILYTNRALFLSQMGKDQAATHDLKRAIELNPVNYIAYFNLFSIQTRNNMDYQAFSNLCCSLSVMYLIKARITKKITDARKSLTFASNNLQAHILCGLIHLQTCQYQAAKQDFIAALKLHPQKTLLYRLLGQTSKKIDPQFDDSSLIGMQDKNQQLISKPLIGSFVLPPQADLIQQINKRVNEFDLLYNEINNQFLGVTQKVPQQTSSINKIQAFMLDKSRCTKSNQGSVIAILQDQQYFANKSQNYEPKQNYQKNVQNDGDGIESTVTAVHSTKGIEIIQQDQQIGDISNDQISKSSNHIVNFYPVGYNNKIDITVISFTNIYQSQNLQNVYCLITYQELQSKLFTDPVNKEQQQYIWNKQFNNIIISQYPSQLQVKLYSKQNTQMRDKFFGKLSVVLTKAEVLSLPVMNQNSQLIGKLLLKIELSSS